MNDKHAAVAAERISYPYPLGATVTPDGTNFSIFSASATGMEIVLFDHPDDLQASSTTRLDPILNRTSHYWHVFLPGIKSGQLYGYRADGPYEPSTGQRFDRQKVLLDPYGRSVAVGPRYNRTAACQPGDTAGTSMKSVVTDPISLEDYLRKAHVEWHGVQLGKPDWRSDSHSIALALHNYALNQVRYIAINAHWKPLRFELPPLADHRSSWHRMTDTSLLPPNDIAEVGLGSEVMGSEYVVNPHSLIMLRHSPRSPGRNSEE